jgi:hypothetical protein
LVELQVAVELPLLTNFECLAKSLTIIKGGCDLSSGRALIRWFCDGTVKARKDRCVLSPQ